MVRNIIAVIAGLIIGSIVNMTLVNIGPMVVPPPAGADVTTMEGLRASMPMFETKHFIFPFLAHALGTFVGALLAALIAISHRMTFALVIGTCFLVGGIFAAFMLGAPMWYNAIDIIVAYIPMAWIGGKIGKAIRPA